MLSTANLTYWFQIWSKELDPDTNKPFFFSEQILKKDNTSFLSNVDFPEPTNAVMSFNVEEEEFLATTVNLTIRDETGLLLETFGMGKVFYYRYGFLEEGLFNELKETFSNEISYRSNKGGNIDDPLNDKNGILCFVTNFPKFKMEADVCEFMVNLRAGFTYQRFPVTFTYNSGTIEEMVLKVCEEELRLNGNYEIHFEGMFTALDNSNSIVRISKTPTAFLKQIAALWNVRLVYNFDKGKRFLIMLDWDEKELMQSSLNKFRKTNGLYQYFDYGHSKANSISLEGSIEPAQLGSVAIPTISPDGKPSMMFLPSGQIVTTMWVFDFEKTKTTLQKKYATKKGKAEIDALAEDIKASNDIKSFFEDSGKPLEKYKEFFRPHTDYSAPEGGGVTIELQTIPNPVYWVADLAWLGSNPDLLVDEEDSFYFKSESSIPHLFRSREGNMDKLTPLSSGKVVKTSVRAGRYTSYRIAKVSWTHDGSGVTQKIRLKR